jgi:hypothetical protein
MDEKSCWSCDSIYHRQDDTTSGRKVKLLPLGEDEEVCMFVFSALPDENRLTKPETVDTLSTTSF